MVFDVLTGILVGIGAGAGLGALSALLGWASGTEPFYGRKFGIAIATGIIAGIGVIQLSLPAIQASFEADPTGTQFVGLMVPIAIGIVGTDLIRSKISAMVANRESESTVKPL